MHHEQMLAARAVARVLEGANLRDALAAVDDDSAARGRTLVQELAYGTLRHYGRLEALAGRLVRKPIDDVRLRVLIDVALYQLDHTRAPAFAVVDRAVAASAQLVRPGAKSFVNAVLRRYLRERDGLNAQIQHDEVARFSYPKWWIDRVRADHPDEWEAILDAGNARPPLTLRANERRIARDVLAQRFVEQGFSAHAVGVAGIIIDAPRPVAELPGFDEGLFSVQDLGAQFAAPFLEVSDGMRVLDACAAPGGKTSHFLELADVDLTSLDVDPLRVARIDQNLVRLQLEDRRVRIVEGDAAKPSTWWDGKAFDRVLLDVPCTASGVVRRHPDGKWRHRASDVDRFAREQARLLEAVWPLLAPGGKLLYSTCSVFAAENGARIDEFVRKHGEALRESLTFPVGVAHRDGQLLPSSSSASHNHDGFFYALLRKR